MRTILCALLLVAITANQGWGEDKHALNGHTWDTWSQMQRASFFMGFSSGYRYGFLGGDLKGFEKGVAKGIWNAEKVGGRVFGEEASQKIYDMSLETHKLESVGLKKGPSFYILEIDEFYKTFPTCKEVGLPMLFSALILQAWSVEDPAKGYKLVGENCLTMTP